MKKIVISQPMFLPWVGLFEQIKLADIYVHYDDVQYPQGRSFTNRVQIKSPTGWQWLTAPIKKHDNRDKINDIYFDESKQWRETHLKTIKYNYSKASFFKEMYDLSEALYSYNTSNLSDFNINIIERVSDYFGMKKEFFKSSELKITGSGTERLLKIVQKFNGDIYITGHGAKNYIDHNLFEKNGIQIEYMNYQLTPYPQQFSGFNPYVTILDLIANVGVEGKHLIHSQTKNWKDFIMN